MWARLIAILVKEFIQLFRDPRMRGIVFVAPILQLMLFSYAATTDVRHIALAVQDEDHSAISRELVARFEGSGYFDVVARLDGDDSVRRYLDEGRTQAVLHVGPGFAADVRAGRPSPAQVIVDGTDSTTGSIVLQYGSRIIAQYAGELAQRSAHRHQGALPRLPQLTVDGRSWFNEDLSSRNFYLPGIIAMLVALITLMLTSMAIVREREIGTMEQLLVTPISPAELMLGKTLPFALVGIVDAVLVLVVGTQWFDVPMRGSLWALALAVVVFLLATLSIGLLISTLAETQQQAMMGTFLFFLPAVLLSGFMFPIANMPVAIQVLTLVNPLRYMMVILRSLFLKGVGLDVLWPQYLALAAVGVATMVLATSRFRRTLA